MTHRQDPIEATPENPLDAELNTAREEVMLMVRLLREHRNGILAGEMTPADAGKIVLEFNKVLAPVEKLKEKLDEQIREDNGVGRSGYAYNLDDARVRVTGCLGRLRKCCGAGGASD